MQFQRRMPSLHNLLIDLINHLLIICRFPESHEVPCIYAHLPMSLFRIHIR